MPQRPLVLTIDVEPNGIFLRDSEETAWSGFEAAVREMEPLRASFATRQNSPVHYSWKLRMDRQIEAAFGHPAAVVDRYPQAFESLAEAGDDFGIHVHPFHLGENGGWVADFADQTLVSDTIRAAHHAFCERFGHAPRTASMGHNWQSPATIALFVELGIKVDLSLEHGTHKAPFYDGIGRFEGRRPSFETVSGQPFRPARDDFLAAGGVDALPIWMCPLASAVDAASGTRKKVELSRGAEPLQQLLEEPLDRAPCPAIAVRSSDFVHPERAPAAREALAFLVGCDDIAIVAPLEALALAGLETAGSKATPSAQPDRFARASC